MTWRLYHTSHTNSTQPSFFRSWQSKKKLTDFHEKRNYTAVLTRAPLLITSQRDEANVHPTVLRRTLIIYFHVPTLANDLLSLINSAPVHVTWRCFTGCIASVPSCTRARPLATAQFNLFTRAWEFCDKDAAPGVPELRPTPWMGRFTKEKRGISVPCTLDRLKSPNHCSAEVRELQYRPRLLQGVGLEHQQECGEG